MASLRALLATSLLALSAARIHHLVIKNDPRFAFIIETFGFLNGGTIELDIKDVAVYPADKPHYMGFVVFPVTVVEEANIYVEKLIQSRECAVEYPPVGSLVINISDPSTWKEMDEPGEISGSSDFSVLFTHCSPVGSAVSVSFTLDATLKNPGNNFLSAGEMNLPAVYGVFAVLFAMMMVAWGLWLKRHKQETAKIHYGMTLLLGLKTLTLVFESVMYHYIVRMPRPFPHPPVRCQVLTRPTPSLQAVTGHTTAWNAMFYIFSAGKGFVMVAVSMLVASGWSIMRPFLTEREKKILMVALVLQLLANTAVVMVDELAPGSMQYDAWVWLMHLTDVLSSLAVLIPTTWSMKVLEQTVAASREGDGAGKAQETLARLTRFRNFYFYTISYLYVTRLLVWLLSTRVAYDEGHWPAALEETCTLAYYLYTGIRFRPTSENAYLRVTQDDDDGPGDIELGRASGTAHSSSAGGPVQTVSATQRSAATAAAVEAELGGAAEVGEKPKAASKVVITTDEDEFGLDEELDEAARGSGAGSAAGVARAKPKAAADPATAAEEGWEDDLDGLDDEDEKKDLLPQSARFVAVAEERKPAQLT